MNRPDRRTGPNLHLKRHLLLASRSLYQTNPIFPSPLLNQEMTSHQLSSHNIIIRTRTSALSFVLHHITNSVPPPTISLPSHPRLANAMLDRFPSSLCLTLRRNLLRVTCILFLANYIHGGLEEMANYVIGSD